VSECAKHNHDDTLDAGQPYEDSDIGFIVRNIGRWGDEPILQLKMPNEEDEHQVPFYKPYRQSVRKGGCLYTFSAEKAPGYSIKFTLSGAGEPSVAKVPAQ
jgi:hypothetical protein